MIFFVLFVSFVVKKEEAVFQIERMAGRPPWVNIGMILR
jgi:hypothetical protein